MEEKPDRHPYGFSLNQRCGVHLTCLAEELDDLVEMNVHLKPKTVERFTAIAKELHRLAPKVVMIYELVEGHIEYESDFWKKFDEAS